MNELRFWYRNDGLLLMTDKQHNARGHWWEWAGQTFIVTGIAEETYQWPEDWPFTFADLSAEEQGRVIEWLLRS